MTDEERDFIPPTGNKGAGANGMPPPPPTAMAVFSPGGGMNEFPVLKAFQQYIDAEQNRARKRMLGLCVFFITLLMVVVVTFVLVLMPILSRNQSLQDRLLDMVLTNQTVQQPPAPGPVVNVQSAPAAPAAAPADYESRLNKIQQDNLAALADLRRKYEERDRRREEAERAERAAQDKQRKAELEQLLKASEERVAALEKAAAERAAKADAAAKRAAEREEYLRRQYPGYYEKRGKTESPAAPVAKPAPAVEPGQLAPINGMTDEEAIKRLMFADDEDEAPAPAPAANAPAPAAKPAPAANPDSVMAPRPKKSAPAPAPADADEEDDPNYKPVNYYSQYDDDESAAQEQPRQPAGQTQTAPAKLPFVFLDDDED